MKIAMTGAGGLIGSALTKRLESSGHKIIPLVRDKEAAENEAVFWDPYENIIEKEKLEGFDGVVHLSGENLAERWNDEKKRKIRDSRVITTSLLTETLINLQDPPKVFVSASAIGIYGDRGDEILTEESTSGKGFLADITREWEKASERLDGSSIRSVNLRIAMVLSSEGGALQKMIPAFKTGVGGKIGSGKQYVSWIGIDDLVRIFEFALTEESLRGAVNAVSPNPVTNEKFTEALAEVLGRPSFATIPAFAVKMMFGEMGKETVLSSARAIPKRLQETSFEFQYPDIEKALHAVLKKQ